MFGVDECSLPRAQGSCQERLPRWFFDASENRCMPFYYSGCEGNNNRFETRDVCETVCPPKIGEWSLFKSKTLQSAHIFSVYSIQLMDTIRIKKLTFFKKHNLSGKFQLKTAIRINALLNSRPTLQATPQNVNIV